MPAIAARALSSQKLRALLDSFQGQYRKLRGADDLRAYLLAPAAEADEEILTEPVLRSILREVLGFPQDAIFEQLGKSGLKPDFTPNDLIAHPFVLDAKSTTEKLAPHEPQIRRYMTQRHLDRGVLFNLREVRVYPAGRTGHDPELSFQLLPVWEHARGEALPPEDLERFERFVETFRHRHLSVEEKIRWVASRPSWSGRLYSDDAPEIDVEALVERLRLLSRLLRDDAAAQTDELDHFLAVNPGRAERLLDELKMITLEIAPGTNVESLPADIGAWRDGDDLVQRAWAQYLLRVAYLALTRILLYRAWEDVQLVDEYLHDGGFEKWYTTYDESVERVLREAFLHGSEQYPWLYGRENNYDWFRPRQAALVEVLYQLVPEPLGRLDADVLGSLYATYVEEIDRDRLGQFYTPRDVVAFMLDQAGFSGHDGVFRVEGDRRKPRQVLDFATGSGGFLVEAARRIVDAVPTDEPQALREALQAILAGFVGAEISPFPYYLTEINVLLQVSRVLGYLRTCGEELERVGTLGVLHVDTLTAKSGAESLEVDGALRADGRELLATRGFDLVPLTGEKLDVYRARLSTDGSFDLVVGNPPYVAEANNKPLFERLRAIPAWQGIYRGKTDYLYYFLWLAAEKIAPGGRLCVITPAGWMNAGAADFLREKLASELRIDLLFLFGSYRLFAFEGDAPTPTVESCILVASKAPTPKGHAVRVVALEDEAAAPNERAALLAEMARRARGKAGRRSGIHVHDIPQDLLQARYPWPVKHGTEDVAARVVGHLQAGLDEDRFEPLARSWKVFQGIQTGADAYTARIQRRLSAETRQQLGSAGAQTGDPIMELPPATAAAVPWKEHPKVVVRNPESRAILYGAVDEADSTRLVVLRGSEVPPESVLRELERWRPVLATRAEIERNPRRQWWETAWPRDETDMKAPKVIALYRTDRGRFVLDEVGEWQPSIKATIAVGKSTDAPVAYLCGVLNSELLDLWYAVRGKTPRDVWRNYEPKRMNEDAISTAGGRSTGRGSRGSRAPDREQPSGAPPAPFGCSRAHGGGERLLASEISGARRSHDDRGAPRRRFDLGSGSRRSHRHGRADREAAPPRSPDARLPPRARRDRSHRRRPTVDRLGREPRPGGRRGRGLCNPRPARPERLGSPSRSSPGDHRSASRRGPRVGRAGRAARLRAVRRPG